MLPMSHNPLTLPFQAIWSLAVTFKSTELFAVLSTSVATTPCGSAPSWKAPKPPPPMVPLYWTSGHWPTATARRTFVTLTTTVPVTVRFVA